MEFDFDLVNLEAQEAMENSVKKYRISISKISAGRANPKILDHIKIDYFGVLTPINQLANISVPEARQLLIKPYDMSLNKDIVRVINAAALGSNAIDEGDKTRMTFPEITTERRREITKSLNQYTEQAKISIRSSRQSANKQIKQADNIPEDQEKAMLEEIQKLTDKFIHQVDEITKEKETELMTI